MAALPDIEGKMLSEALNTVKIQVQHMKRYLVRTGRLASLIPHYRILFNNLVFVGDGTAYGCFKECKYYARRIADLLPKPEAVL